MSRYKTYVGQNYVKRWDMSIKCSRCGAKPHRMCRTRSGNVAMPPHAARRRDL